MRIFVISARVRRFCSAFVIGIIGLGCVMTAQTEINEPIRKGADTSNVAVCCNVFWGEEYLPKMLQILAEEDVKISFFIGGTWAKDNPELLREIKAAGHEIGNHSYNHPHVNKLTKEENKQQIIRTANIIEEICGVKTQLYAPPYGEYNNTVLLAAAELDYPVVLWSIDTVDWKKPPAELIVQRVKNKLHNGAIILIHPTKPTSEALRNLLREIKQQQYKILPLSQILNNNETH